MMKYMPQEPHAETDHLCNSGSNSPDNSSEPVASTQEPNPNQPVNATEEQQEEEQDNTLYHEDTDSVMYGDLAGLLPLPRRNIISRIGRMLKKEVTGHGPEEDRISGVIFLHRNTNHSRVVPQLPSPESQRQPDRVVRLPRARALRPVRYKPTSEEEQHPSSEDKKASIAEHPPIPKPRRRRWGRNISPSSPEPPSPSRGLRFTPGPKKPSQPLSNVLDVGAAVIDIDSEDDHETTKSLWESAACPSSSPCTRPTSRIPDTEILDVESAIIDIDSEDEDDLYSAKSLSRSSTDDSTTNIAWRTALSAGSTIRSDAVTTPATSPISSPRPEEPSTPRRIWEISSTPAWQTGGVQNTQYSTYRTRPYPGFQIAPEFPSNDIRDVSDISDHDRMQHQHQRNMHLIFREPNIGINRPNTPVAMQHTPQREHVSRKPRVEQMPAYNQNHHNISPRRAQHPSTIIDGVGLRGPDPPSLIPCPRRRGQRPLPRTRKLEEERRRARTDAHEIIPMQQDDFVEFQSSSKQKKNGRQFRLLSNVSKFHFVLEENHRHGDQQRIPNSTNSVGPSLSVSSVARRARLLQKYS